MQLLIFAGRNLPGHMAKRLITDRGPLVRRLMEHFKENQVVFAKRYGVSQGTVSRWLNGGGIDVDNWEALKHDAIAKGIDPQYFQRRTPIVGYVSAGAKVAYYNAGQGPFDDAETPAGAPETTVAVEVRGDSLQNVAQEGWLLYYDERHDPPHDGLIGRLCIIWLPDDSVLAKYLKRGRRQGLYDLHSTNADPILDQTVVSAAEVIWIKPRYI